MPEIAGHIPLILGDGREMGRMAAEHLLEQGLGSFAYFGLTRSAHSQERRGGFAERLALAGYTASVFEWPFARLRHALKPGSGSLMQWLKKLPKPAGVLAITDILSTLVSESCILAGMHVPDEVAIIGIDNDEDICETFTPPLSSVALNESRIGAEALDLLCDIVKHKTKMAGQRLIIRPTHVAVRQSTSVVACESEEVQKAIRFIEDHAGQAVGVEDVAAAAAVNSTTLQQKFRKFLGETVHSRVEKVRIRHISRMLVETDMSVSKIASTAGFSQVGNLTQFFRNCTGMTPLQYRRKYGTG
jgi:LacI family transcriptional regulator